MRRRGREGGKKGRRERELCSRFVYAYEGGREGRKTETDGYKVLQREGK
jgi:hypothetical protein